MRFYRYRWLHHVVLLLLTIFVINTVYASGMMVSMPNEVSPHQVSDKNHALHCHHADVLDQNSSQKSHDNCKACSHCLACFAAMAQSALVTVVMSPQMVLAISFANIYAPPVDIQPQKPPIS